MSSRSAYAEADRHRAAAQQPEDRSGSTDRQRPSGLLGPMLSTDLERSSALALQFSPRVISGADPAEREAERIAGEVVGGSRPLSAVVARRTPTRIATKAGCACGGSCPTCAGRSTGSTGPNLDGVQRVLRTPGRALEADTRGFMEARFARSFADVRIHTDSAATRSAHSLGARAYTSGRDIVFGAGAYRPSDSGGRRLIAHELVHVVQQGSSGQRSRSEPVIQRQDVVPGSAVPPAPSAGPLPASGAFGPLSRAALGSRVHHGLSQQTGPMMAEIENQIFRPAPGSRCIAIPDHFEHFIAPIVAGRLLIKIPDLSPADAPDPMPIAEATARIAMPYIASYYSPHAPHESATTFIARLSRNDPAVGKRDVYDNPNELGRFLNWMAGADEPLRLITGPFCLPATWWQGFASWLRGPGSFWDGAPFYVTRRVALYETFLWSTHSNGSIRFGRGFELYDIPGTVIHEAMHHFQHADLRAQVDRMSDIGGSREDFIEGMAEYLKRQIQPFVVDKLLETDPTAIAPALVPHARTAGSYEDHYQQVIRLRDILYRHGQNGEEAVRRAFFVGEGWRFGLVEDSGSSSTIETDRPLPGSQDVHFDSRHTTLLDPAVLAPMIVYASSRRSAHVQITGMTDPHGSDTYNVELGQRRALAVRRYLVGQGVFPDQITELSAGESGQIPGGDAANRRAQVEIFDPRNEYPGRRP